MSTRTDFAPLETATYDELTQRFNAATDPETRLRYQIVLLAHQGLTNAQIAPLVLRSRDIIERVRKRFRNGGLDAVPYKKPGRSEPKVTPVWKAELERVVALDPHAVGIASANWTTQLLSGYLYQKTGIPTGQETVRLYLHQIGFVCKRPTWTLKNKAKEQEGYLGKRLRVEALLRAATNPLLPPLSPEEQAVAPVDLADLLALVPRADVYLQDEVQFALHPTLTRVWCRKGRRGQRLVCAPGDNAKVYGFGLVDFREGFFDGAFAQKRSAPPFCAQIERAIARSKARGRVAIVIADNLGTHTPARSKLVRRLMSDHSAGLRLVYTPPYDPDSNGIEQLWRVSRRVVTHNHQRATLPELLADAQAHFDHLARHPDEVLRHIGSPGIDTSGTSVNLPIAA